MIATLPDKMAVDTGRPSILTDAIASLASPTEDDPLWYKDAII